MTKKKKILKIRNLSIHCLYKESNVLPKDLLSFSP